MNLRTRIALVGLLALSGIRCSDPNLPRPDFFRAKVRPFILQSIPTDSLWWTWPCCADSDGFPVDANGIPTLVIQGKVTYHPSYIIENALAYESSYRKSGNPFYRTKLVEWTGFLIQRADTLDEGAIYVPFDFDFALHGDEAEMVHAPWYSGFAQGMFLSLLVRTARLTGDPAHADAAHRVFRSLADTHSQRVAHIDTAGYYWIDEYPSADPDLTLNGFLFAMRGVYEYWQWQQTPESKRLLRAGLTTARRYAGQFRVSGQASVYCLKHRIPAPAYHAQIIELLRDLYRMTGDDSFRQLADEFATDKA